MQAGRMKKHPEGGRFQEVYRSSMSVVKTDGQGRTAMTHIYFSLEVGEVSRFHMVKSDEVWNLYEGAVSLYVWDDEAQTMQCHELSAVDRSYCVIVEAGKWQAAKPLDESVLVGCTVAPGFEFEDFKLIDPSGDVASRITSKFPELLPLI